jgi:hypothetical protein
VASRQTGLYSTTGHWDVARSLSGTVGLRVTSMAGGTPVFPGIAQAEAVFSTGSIEPWRMSC